MKGGGRPEEGREVAGRGELMGMLVGGKWEVVGGGRSGREGGGLSESDGREGCGRWFGQEWWEYISVGGREGRWEGVGWEEMMGRRVVRL